MNQTEWPLFVFLDDTSLEICESLEVARRDYEGIDVESGVFSFYDFSGCPMKPVFTVPNRHSVFLGVMQSSSSGVFEFERDSALNLDPIDVALQNATSLSSNDRFADLDEIAQHLEHRGCRMDRFENKKKTTQAEQAAS